MKRWVENTILFVMLMAIIVLGSKYSASLVVSGSMEPYIRTNSFVIIDKLFKDIEVGDVIVYRADGKDIIHRVIAKENIEDDGHEVYTTKGDNNYIEDQDKVSKSMVKGKMALRLSFTRHLVGGKDYSNGGDWRVVFVTRIVILAGLSGIVENIVRRMINKRNIQKDQ